MKQLLATVTALIWLTTPMAQATPAEDAARAAAQLQTATQKLAKVSERRDRVRALSDTIDALELGMSAMRQSLRQAAIQETTLKTNIAAREKDITRLLGTLQTISLSPEPSFLLHPMGPTGTARSGMILADVTPALQAEAATLKAQLTQIQDLQSLQLESQQVLQNGLEGVQSARIQLSDAISNRTELPRRFSEDPTKTALLLATRETLGDFANGLSAIALDEIPVSQPLAQEVAGNLRLPALGALIRKFNENDAAGIKRPGIILATDAGALVRAPTSATIRYQGPLLDYGQVVILEPAADTLFIFAGLGQVFVQTGEVVINGAPLGLMPEATRGGNARQDTLYIEVRVEQAPVDPATWFTAS